MTDDVWDGLYEEPAKTAPSGREVMAAAMDALRTQLRHLERIGYGQRADEIARDVAQYVELRTRAAKLVPAETDRPW